MDKYPGKEATVSDFEKYYSTMYYSQAKDLLDDLKELIKTCKKGTAAYNSLNMKIQALTNLMDVHDALC